MKISTISCGGNFQWVHVTLAKFKYTSSILYFQKRQCFFLFYICLHMFHREYTSFIQINYWESGLWCLVRVKVFSATFSNIEVRSWRSVLFGIQRKPTTCRHDHGGLDYKIFKSWTIEDCDKSQNILRMSCMSNNPPNYVIKMYFVLLEEIGFFCVCFTVSAIVLFE